MALLRNVCCSLLAGTIAMNAGLVSGQSFPDRPIRVLSGDAGGPADIAIRLIGPGVSASLGQQVVVDNRYWVNAIESAAKALPDGYTLLSFVGVTWIAPLLRDNLSWDALRDFSPVTLAGRTAAVLVVHPSLPVKSVKDVIALAKARPGELNCATGPLGSSTHLAMEVFKSMAGVNVVRVPYKGNIQALTALVGGQVQMFFANVPAAAPYVRAGRLKALAVTSAEPSALAPALPTMAASGLLGYEVDSITAILAPAKTPAAVINRLNQEIVRVINRPEVKEKFLNAGMEPVGSTPERLLGTMKAEIARLGKVIKEAGIRDE
jgi:tripartite-type tricarboxylate transporter receptor subunit TctC